MPYLDTTHGRAFAGSDIGGVVYPEMRISASDSGSIDAFGRQRVSEPETIFDSKQIFDNLPFFWDDQETAGGGTASTYSKARASTTLSVSAATAGTRVRQTFRRFNYQPGKSQLIFATFSNFTTLAGNTKRVGYLDDDNGLFLQSSGGVLQAVIRSGASGAAVDTVVSQSDWNLDRLDGTGPSQIVLDPSKSQIAVIDFEWLGVGRVRVGFVINGLYHYVHEFNNANHLDAVYMSTPNLPIRYEVSNDGAGPADSFEVICSAVISEGGAEKTGILRSKSTAGTHLDANAANQLYAVIGLRLKSDYYGATIQLARVSMLSEGQQDFEWSLWWNPTVAGVFTYGDETHSACQTAMGATANTVTGGTMMDSGQVASSQSLGAALENALALGSTIAGVADQIVLCVRPFGGQADIQASITWRELL